jgi:small multidrug resistance pump
MPDRPPTVADDSLARFRGWLYAAAGYNAIWGTSTIVAPDAIFRVLHMGVPQPDAVWRCVGMFVLVFAPAYACAGRRPAAHAHLVLVGMAGKVLGPIGYLWAAVTGQLPWVFGAVILANDVVWWPAFSGYLRRAARAAGGWPRLLRGDVIEPRPSVRPPAPCPATRPTTGAVRSTATRCPLHRDSR